MSQLTKAEIVGVATSKAISICDELADTIKAMIENLNLNEKTAARVKELDKHFQNKNLHSKSIKKQIDEVSSVMKELSFIDLNSSDKEQLTNIMWLKHTEMANYVNVSEIQKINTDFIHSNTFWNDLVKETDVRRITHQVDHTFKSFSEVCNNLNFIEKEKQIHPQETSYIKAVDLNGNSVFLVTQNIEDKIHIKLDPGEPDPRKKGCQKISQNFLKGLKDKGIHISNVKTISHNNPLGLIRLKVKKNIKQVVGFVNGTMNKSSNQKSSVSYKSKNKV